MLSVLKFILSHSLCNSLSHVTCYDQVDLMTFGFEFCPRCRVIDCMVVKSPPKPPSMPGWGEVGPYFDRCIRKSQVDVAVIAKVSALPDDCLL